MEAAREAEVLYWVAQGKSNPDIGLKGACLRLCEEPGNREVARLKEPGNLLGIESHDGDRAELFSVDPKQGFSHLLRSIESPDRE